MVEPRAQTRLSIMGVLSWDGNGRKRKGADKRAVRKKDKKKKKNENRYCLYIGTRN
jgi:hypothetical protein